MSVFLSSYHRSVLQWFLSGLCFLLFIAPVSSWAKGEYKSREAFVAEVLGTNNVASSVLWLSGDLKNQVKLILGHDYPALRVRYWQREGSTAWVLEEIGKELPITVGVLVSEGVVQQVDILVYRESRGGEVRHDFFTRQFDGAKLESDQSLSRRIDNITGATLSVRAVSKLARLALLFDARVSSAHEDASASSGSMSAALVNKKVDQ
jgi:hypothetical protein